MSLLSLSLRKRSAQPGSFSAQQGEDAFFFATHTLALKRSPGQSLVSRQRCRPPSLQPPVQRSPPCQSDVLPLRQGDCRVDLAGLMALVLSDLLVVLLSVGCVFLEKPAQHLALWHSFSTSRPARVLACKPPLLLHPTYWAGSLPLTCAPRPSYLGTSHTSERRLSLVFSLSLERKAPRWTVGERAVCGASGSA